jgi:hypothetical protein
VTKNGCEPAISDPRLPVRSDEMSAGDVSRKRKARASLFPYRRPAGAAL